MLSTKSKPAFLLSLRKAFKDCKIQSKFFGDSLYIQQPGFPLLFFQMHSSYVVVFNINDNFFECHFKAASPPELIKKLLKHNIINPKNLTLPAKK